MLSYHLELRARVTVRTGTLQHTFGRQLGGLAPALSSRVSSRVQAATAMLVHNFWVDARKWQLGSKLQPTA